MFRSYVIVAERLLRSTVTTRETWVRSGQCRIVVYSRIVVIRCRPSLLSSTLVWLWAVGVLSGVGVGAGKEKGRCRSERVKSTCSIVFAVCSMVAGTLHSWPTRSVYCSVELGPSIYVG